jgi:uncharacterized membrane protein
MSNKWLWGLILAIFTLGCPSSSPKNTDAPTPTDPEALYQEMQAGDKTVRFHGIFTEPFRDLYIFDGQVLLVDFEQRYSYTLDQPFDPSLAEQTLSFGEGQKVTILKQPGSDGMSDRTYPYTVRWEDPDYPQLGGGDSEWMQDWSKYEADVPAYYICYTGEADNNLAISIAFAEDGTAM